MGTDDDFLVARNVDTDKECDSIEDIILYKYLFIILSILSIISNVYLLWMYFVLKTPVLKRHPTSLAIYRCIFDLLFYQQYLWAPFIRNEFFYSDDLDHSPYYCNASIAAGCFAFLTQFSFLGGELCFFIISLDLRICYTNPFTSVRQNWRKFAAFVIITSLVFAGALILMGPRVYGMASNGTIWIQDRRDLHSMNYPKLLLYYFVLLIIYSYTIWATLQFSKQGGVVSRTLSNRLAIIHRSQRFVFGYILFDSIILCLEFLSYLGYGTKSVFNSVSAYAQASRGVANTIVILYSNWSEVTWETMWPFTLQQPAQVMLANVTLEKLLLQPHLNTALRAEVLYFSTQGIILAARDNERRRALHSSICKKHDCSGCGDEEANSGGNGTLTPELNNDDPGLSRMYSLTGTDANSRPSRAEDKFNSAINEVTGVAAAKSLSSRQDFDKEGSFASTTHRDTFYKLHQLNITQDALVQPQIEAAFQDAVEMLGSDPMRVSLKLAAEQNGKLIASSSNKSNTKTQSNIDNNDQRYRDSDIDSDFGVPVANSPRQSFQRGWRASLNFLGLGNKNSTTTKESICNPLNEGDIFRDSEVEMQMHMESGNDRQDSDDRPLDSSIVNLAAAAASRGNNDIDYRSQFITQQQSYENNHRDQRNSEDSGASSQVTVKWRDTMDVEFSMAQNGFSGDGYSNSDLPTWQRVSKLGTQSNDGNDSRNISSDQTRSSGHSRSLSILDPAAMSKLTKSLRTAVNTATEAAITAFYPIAQDFRFKDFRPKLFAQIREMFDVGHEEYAASFESTCKERFTEGKSGAFMYFSSNQKYIVKTTSKSEMKNLQRILVNYIDHLKKYPSSLLVRILGAHCVTMYGNEMYFIVMLNFFPTENFSLSERYDLKGSWVNRHGFTGSKRTKTELRCRDLPNTPPLYLDNDLQNKLSLELTVAEALAEQIHIDIDFLQGCNLMDYSLLIGVKRERFEVVGPSNNSNLSRSVTNSSMMDDTLDRSEYLHTREDNFSSTPLTSVASPTTKQLTEDELRNHKQRGESMSWLAVRNDNQLNDSIMNNQERSTLSTEKGIRARYVEGPGTYYLGIIDILQEWNWQKRLERWAKVYIYGQDPDGLSAIKPIMFALRFWKRCVLDTFEGLESFIPVRRAAMDAISSEFGLQTTNNSLFTSSIISIPGQLPHNNSTPARASDQNLPGNKNAIVQGVAVPVGYRSNSTSSVTQTTGLRAKNVKQKSDGSGSLGVLGSDGAIKPPVPLNQTTVDNNSNEK